MKIKWYTIIFFSRAYTWTKTMPLRFCKFLWKWLKKGILWLYEWLYYKLFPRYKLTVSYDKEWENDDDREYEVKKMMIEKPNYLKFKTDDGIVEIRSPSGINTRLEEL